MYFGLPKMQDSSARDELLKTLRRKRLTQPPTLSGLPDKIAHEVLTPVPCAQAHGVLVAIVENSLRGEKTQPSISELRQLAGEIGVGQKSWNEIFPSVATITLTTSGYGPSIDLRISKTGLPVQLVPEGTPGAAVVAVKRVDDLGFYNLGRDQRLRMSLSPSS